MREQIQTIWLGIPTKICRMKKDTTLNKRISENICFGRARILALATKCGSISQLCSDLLDLWTHIYGIQLRFGSEDLGFITSAAYAVFFSV